MTYIYITNKENKCVIQRRNENDIWKGLYQFPLIEHRQNTNIESILESKEIKYLTDNQQFTLERTETKKHLLTHRQLFITILFVKLESLDHLSTDNYLTIYKSDLKDYAFPKPLSSVLDEA